MRRAGASRRRIARTLNAAYADGLISHDTLVSRLDLALAHGLVDPRRLIGDLSLRASSRLQRRVSQVRRTIVRWPERLSGEDAAALLALDWDAPDAELMIGRHPSCDVVLPEPEVSRRHARLVLRDGVWSVQDLESMNGTFVNGARVGRARLRPGDRLQIATQEMRVD